MSVQCGRPPRAKVLVIALAIAGFGSNSAFADEAQDEIRALKEQMSVLMKRIDDLSRKQEEKAAPSAGISMKPGNDVTFKVGGSSEVQIYGHVDVSLDSQTNGLAGAVGATGNNGWVSDVSSNLSFFGIRGNRDLGDGVKGLFQFETEVYYAATPGASDQAPDGTAQKSGLGSRNSFIGLQSATYGAVKLGKTDTPYKTSTARMDPFASSVGDYNSIMGNTGGDARAEFDLRLSHSAWYESPSVDGWTVSALFSPGQNRSTDGLMYALGEPDCTGGNSVGPQNSPAGCNDGAFKNAYSASLAYAAGPLYATVSYEKHQSVNRAGDDSTPGSVGIRDESAYKLGVQYAFDTGTTANLIYERMRRDAVTSAEDERTRNGVWFALTQQITPVDFVNFGWAHAYATPGQPISSPGNMTTPVAITGAVDNAADQFSLGYKHYLQDKRTTVYLVATQLKNGAWAHYALGPSGHGIVTRDWTGDMHSISGGTEKALSVGGTYDF